MAPQKSRGPHPPTVCSEDVVAKKKDPSVLGLVLFVAGESDDEDEEEEEEPLVEGQVRVCWLNSPEETIEDVTDVTVVDRGFMYGSVVAWAHAPLGQTGTVTGMRVKVDLEHPTSGEVIRGVDSRSLRHIRDIREGSFVVKGTWLGRVGEVLDDVTVAFDDGCKCKCEQVRSESLYAVYDNASDKDADAPYYPGLRVSATSSSYFRGPGATWLKGSWKASHLEGTVVAVEPGSASVFWICSIDSGTPPMAEEGEFVGVRLATTPGKGERRPVLSVTTDGAEVADAQGEEGEDDVARTVAPNEDVPAAGLIPLVWFHPTLWQVGDRTLPNPSWQASVEANAALAEGSNLTHAGGEGGEDRKVSPKGVIAGQLSGGSERLSGAMTPSSSSASQDPAKGQGGLVSSPGKSRKPRRGKASKKEAKRNVRRDLDDEVFALQVVRTDTTVEVMWQDGTKSFDVPAVSLVPVSHFGDHDFWPGEFVVERPQDGEAGSEADIKKDKHGKPIIAPPRPRVGSVTSVDAEQRTARVKWLKTSPRCRHAGPVAAQDVVFVSEMLSSELISETTGLPAMAKETVNGEEEEEEEPSEEVVSVYDLAVSDDYAYGLGDVVVRLPMTGPLEIEGSGEPSGATEGEVDGEGEGSAVALGAARGGNATPLVVDGETPGVTSARETMCWVGEIIGLEGGKVHVAWANGKETWVAPSEIYVVSHEEDDEESGEEEEDGESWETDSGGDEVDVSGQHSRERSSRLNSENSTEAAIDASQADLSPVIARERGASRSSSMIGSVTGFVARLTAGLIGSSPASSPEGSPLGTQDKGQMSPFLRLAEGLGMESLANRLSTPGADSVSSSGSGSGRESHLNRRSSEEERDERDVALNNHESNEQASVVAIEKEGGVGGGVVGEVVEGKDQGRSGEEAAREVSGKVSNGEEIKARGGGREIVSEWKEQARVSDGATLNGRSNIPPRNLLEGISLPGLESLAVGPGSISRQVRREDGLEDGSEGLVKTTAVAAAPGTAAERSTATEKAAATAAGAATATTTAGFESAKLSAATTNSPSSATLPLLTSSISSNSKKFNIPERFESLSGPPTDHHFLAEPTGLYPRKWVKIVQSQWAILQQGLPDTVWVRVYEQRMDLLRAVIVGPSSTPYADSLFVFDVWLSPDFPASPPVLHYHSFGYRVNPNLYESGKVCLSLLNTWTGRGSEVWHPGVSTLLQVFVSLQGLVLVAKPYYNEAGYERQMGTAEGERNALLYNESAFLLSCKSTLQLLRRPPLGIEDLVLALYRRHAPRILAACKAYDAGVPVGSPLPDPLADTCPDARPDAQLDARDDAYTGALQPSNDNTSVVVTNGPTESSQRSSNGLKEEPLVGGTNGVKKGGSAGFKLVLGKVVQKLEVAFAQL
eukprot:TRINITY_DN17172_c1_g4_i1.p1 TRINITY_DN17172_c1_g4~~TRINITY_DN17172_c1_g4_i1.p1  ORF type:complete len:1392 (+),score=291.27 TRINITY_DN17172_c1_g4_i1:430-4605(+)